jgi:hypothetical protein
MNLASHMPNVTGEKASPERGDARQWRSCSSPLLVEEKRTVHAAPGTL